MIAQAVHPGAEPEMRAWMALPFALLLASIAAFPLFAPSFWHRHYGKVAALVAIPTTLLFTLVLGDQAPFWRSEYLHAAREYATFILLLAALYVTAGGIFLRGNFSGTPGSNLAILAAGTILANLVGTTGAAMVLIRPLLRANLWRERKVHLVVFFIFSVCNCGGCLTPLGDPPLFLGFLRGVPFGWTLGLWREWGVLNALLLAAFYALDRRVFAAEVREGRSPPHPMTDERLGAAGVTNVLLILGILGTVLLQGLLRLEGGSSLPWGVQEGLFVLWIALSLRLTDPEIRRANRFAWGPIREVAVLFAAIFATMAPALALLRARAPLLGLSEPWELFWATGSLSGVLDNAPTYLAFLSVAQGAASAGTAHGADWIVGVRPEHLAAISCGAVFMGALTYIGNAPNLMVKAIAEETGVRMPGFLGYLVWPAAILLPLFVLLTFLFF